LTRQFHVISGLPRSGSTLLSAILRQNPRFHADVTSPILTLTSAVQDRMTANSEFSSFFDDNRRRAILRGLVESYHSGVGEDQVVFDTNRLWTGKSALLRNLYADARLICCVREVGWIIDSLERMLRKNPLQHSRVFQFKPGTSVYGRVETLMNSESGLIGLPWSALREAWFSEDAKHLIIVPYESLVRDPGRVISGLYKELGEAPFQHDFERIDYNAPAYDADLGMPGLHEVRPAVEMNRREPSIPPDIFAEKSKLSFWNRPNLNRRGVTVL
jgi:sulfotransferase